MSRIFWATIPLKIVYDPETEIIWDEWCEHINEVLKNIEIYEFKEEEQMSDTATKRLLKCKAEAYTHFDRMFDKILIVCVYEDPTLIKIKKFGFYGWVGEPPETKATCIDFDMDDEMFKLLKADNYLLYKEIAKNIEFNLNNRKDFNFIPPREDK